MRAIDAFDRLLYKQSCKVPIVNSLSSAFQNADMARF